MVHPLEVWLQSRVAARKASQVDFRFGREFLVLTHDLAQEYGTEAVHRRLAVLSVHQTGELIQLLQDVRLEIPFLADLPDTLLNLGFFSTFFRTSSSPFPLKALVLSSPLNTSQEESHSCLLQGTLRDLRG